MRSPWPCPPRFLAPVLAGCAAVLPAQEQPPVAGGVVTSLGQPPAWTWTAGAASGSLNGLPAEAREVPQLRLGTARAIGNPVVGVLGAQLEAYAGPRDGALEGGLRARLLMPFARFAIGSDYNLRDGNARMMLSLVQPVRRGGLFHDGSVARIDYVPSRDHSLAIGVDMPLFRRGVAGRTRPFRDHVRLRGEPGRSAAPEPAAAAALAVARESAAGIRALAVPFLGRAEPPPGSRPPVSPTDPLPAHLRDIRATVARLDAADPGTAGEAAIARDTRRFHDALDLAFTAAIRPATDAAPRAATPSGARLADAARRALLEDLLLPYNRLLGQARVPSDSRPLWVAAERRFGAALAAEDGLPAARREAARAVFRAVLEIVEQARARLAADWGDARFVWLPLQYALRPEEHDEQHELDALVAAAVGQPFSDGNSVSYVINEQFQYQLSRTIHAAEDYHVLWTHDFRGVDDVGNVDEMSYRQVVRSYLAALTARVRAYDSTGTFPTYIIIHDQWYYSVRKGRLFLELLEDPTRHRLRLPRAARAWADTIAAAQAELRAAIAASTRLQAQRRQYGEEWLRALVKVHVNVTNRPDDTFSSWRLVRGMPVTDNILRDHRKLVLYDLSEEDPYRGEAIYTGAGVGEHYSNLTWEDRSLLVRGPALHGLKAEVRAVLLANGMRARDLPYALRPRAAGPEVAARVREATAASEWPARALSVHSGSGYLPKDVNVAKAVLYTLMPPGSVVLVPDSFWASEFWGAALFGAALRGVRVLVIAPSHRSNSVEYFGTQLLTRELLSRMLVARDALAPELAAAGGMLQLGVFDTQLSVVDMPGKVAAVRATFEQTAWLRELFGFPAQVYEDFRSLEAQVRGLALPTSGPGVFEFDAQTKLHLKANFFASREAWTMMTLPNWGEFAWTFATQRLAQVQSRESVVAFERPADPLLEIGGHALVEWYEALDDDARSRVVFYTVMGSANQNYRSMVTDAEVAFIVAQWPSVIPYLDAITLVGQSRWLRTQAELDALMPPVGRLKVWLTHWARLVH